MIPSIYLNLEDDVSKIVERVKREKSTKLVLVCPKRCFLFNDSINLRLLKKQIDSLGKEVFILTMDERGRIFAEEAGFQLKSLPAPQRQNGFSDIRSRAVTQPILEKPSVKATQFKKQAYSAEIEEPVYNKNPVSFLPAEPLISSKVIAPILPVEPVVEITDTVYPTNPEILDEEQNVKRKSKVHQRVLMSLVFLTLVTILILVFIVLPKATVTIYPKKEPLTRDMEISFNINQKSPDSDKLILPATNINQTIELSDKFQSQGKKEVGNPANGTVQIYNFTKGPISLKANTTTFILGTKTYRLEDDITALRPTTYKNSVTKEIDQDSLGTPVVIVANEGGESSSVPAGVRLEINNQVFGSKPQFLYAKTVSPIAGGTSRLLSLVSQQDITTAQETLANTIIQNLTNSLKSSHQAFIDKSYLIEPVTFTTDKDAGAQSPTFNADLKVKITGLSFNVDDLKQLITARISQTLSPNKTIQITDADQLVFKLKTLDLNNGLGIMTIHYEGNVVYSIDLDNVTGSLVGKTQSQVNEILQSKAEIDHIDMVLAPSWQKTFPYFANKIAVRVVQ